MVCSVSSAVQKLSVYSVTWILMLTIFRDSSAAHQDRLSQCLLLLSQNNLGSYFNSLNLEGVLLLKYYFDKWNRSS